MTKTEPAFLLVCAHAGDFVWRADPTIKATVMSGERTVITVCLSLGEYGKSAIQWCQNKPLVKGMKIRCGEVEAAAARRGAEIAFLTLGDHFILESPKVVERIVRLYRRVWSTVVRTHTFSTRLPVFT